MMTNKEANDTIVSAIAMSVYESRAVRLDYDDRLWEALMGWSTDNVEILGEAHFYGQNDEGKDWRIEMGVPDWM
jgi:hypothetical protein